MQKVIAYLVKKYQKNASFALRASCRFSPSCSGYMLLAVDKYGPIRGTMKGLQRLFRCRPPYGGIDIP